MSNIVVGMADLNICRAPDTLTTIGLGSCVGIAIRDPVTKVGGLLHAMLPDSTVIKDNKTVEKFVDTGLEELVHRMIRSGASKSRMEAKLAGGARMFAFQRNSDLVKVGERNVAAAKKKLQEMNIRLLAEDTGKDYGRTVIWYPESGKYVIRAVGKSETYI